MAKQANDASRSDAPPTSGGNSRAIVSYSLLALGIALMAAGIWRGELVEIMRKAVTVCLECIGLA